MLNPLCDVPITIQNPSNNIHLRDNKVENVSIYPFFRNYVDTSLYSHF